jgi:hypothetical protein
MNYKLLTHLWNLDTDFIADHQFDLRSPRVNDIGPSLRGRSEAENYANIRFKTKRTQILEFAQAGCSTKRKGEKEKRTGHACVP